MQERYTKIRPAGIPSDFEQLNGGIYAALSRDSHARLRTEPAALTIQPDGTVRVTPRRLDETGRRRTLLHCLETSLTAPPARAPCLLDARSRIEAEKPRSLAGRAVANDLPRGVSPDLGLH